MKLKKRKAIYCIEYKDEQGGRRRVSLKTSNESEALMRLAEFTTSPSDTKSLRRFGEELLSLIKHHYAESSYGRLKGIMDCWIDCVGNIPIGKITPALIESYVSYRLKYVSSVTVNLELRTLSGAFGRARKLRMISQNPFADVDKLKTTKAVPVYLTLDEYYDVLKKIPHQWFREIVAFAVYTGARRTEIVELKWWRNW